MRVLSWPAKALRTIKSEGIYGLAEKMRTLAGEFSYRIRHRAPKKTRDTFVDVLFINGCGPAVPHPPRYRVEHQIEQLEASGMSADSVFYLDISMDDVRRARSFIFFRCPYTDTVGEFIERAKALNKTVFFDIDDLVIDTKYTDEIEYLDTMPESERKLYDDGVKAMGKTLRLCDYAITTTEALATELAHYVPTVFINRNVASEQMLHYSNEALYIRDTLPGLQVDQVPKRHLKRYKAIQQSGQNPQKAPVIIGYFSGSITHNEDFEFILPALVKVLDERPETKICVVGELDLPPQLEPYRSRVIFRSFTTWEKLPELISRVDINLAPLTDTLFNAAKSENKWVEASLVKVPTIASNVGAFARMVEQGKTGVLCETVDDWYKALISLVDDPKKRQAIATSAYEYCVAHCLTIKTGFSLTQFIKSKQSPNIAMVVPSLQTSGGILVVTHHCAILQAAGYDVTLLSCGDKDLWYEIADHQIPVLNRINDVDHVDDTPIRGHFDKAIATFWNTVRFLEWYPHIKKAYYLVQSYESDFYLPPDPTRLNANSTYNKDDICYLTISKWCERWLKEDFKRDVRVASNGFESDKFWPQERVFSDKSKIRILIEGDFSAHKNVDESFRIVDKLDPNKFEIWYMSYMAKPKSFYRIDRFLGHVPHEEVANVYRDCHILLKTSILESFSYPPLEMMSTGGFVVVLPNEGNAEYLQDEYNCLTYEQGNLDQAVQAIERICTDTGLREKLYTGGMETAARHDWEFLRSSIVELYK